MAIKTVNSFTHYTEWTVAHVHFGALGWVAMITIGSLYAMAPRALGQPAMHSRAAMELHFWLHTTGVLLYIFSMWIAGITQFLMWRATSPDGSLTYPFIDSLIAIKGLYVVRWFAGVSFSGRHGGDGVEPLAHRCRGARPADQADPGSHSRARAAASADAVAGLRLTGSAPWRAATSTSKRSRRTPPCSAS